MKGFTYFESVSMKIIMILFMVVGLWNISIAPHTIVSLEGTIYFFGSLLGYFLILIRDAIISSKNN